MTWLVVLLACARTDMPATEPPATTSPTTTTPTTTTGPRPAFASPLDAEDLDPDPDVLHVELVAAPTTHVLPATDTDAELVVDGFAYNGQTPGPTLRAKVGDLLVVDLVNAMDVETTIHWHGVAAPYEMDGVTWQIDPIAAGGSFTYTFTLTHAGTFWYHPHFDTERQVDLGLYGMLIVEDPAEPAADDELVLVLDTWQEASPDGVDPDAHQDLTQTPLRWTVNGLERPLYQAPAGTRVRARLVNASNTGYLDLAPQRLIATDQGLLPAAVEDERVLLGPGDRAEVEWIVGDRWALESAPYHLGGGPTWGDPFELVIVEGTGGAATTSPIPWPFPGGQPSPDPPYTDITWVFSGDGGADGWLINGEQYPDVTVEHLPLDSTGIVEVRNLSPSEHPFHLHGHAFEVLSIDGVPPAYRTLEDTVNVRIGGAVRLQVVADNPGYWMAHCHILPHAHQGMMTVLDVSP